MKKITEITITADKDIKEGDHIKTGMSLFQFLDDSTASTEATDISDTWSESSDIPEQTPALSRVYVAPMEPIAEVDESDDSTASTDALQFAGELAKANLKPRWVVYCLRHSDFDSHEGLAKAALNLVSYILLVVFCALSGTVRGTIASVFIADFRDPAQLGHFETPESARELNIVEMAGIGAKAGLVSYLAKIHAELAAVSIFYLLATKCVKSENPETSMVSISFSNTFVQNVLKGLAAFIPVASCAVGSMTACYLQGADPVDELLGGAIYGEQLLLLHLGLLQSLGRLFDGVLSRDENNPYSWLPYFAEFTCNLLGGFFAEAAIGFWDGSGPLLGSLDSGMLIPILGNGKMP